MDRVPVLKLGDVLLVSIQVDLEDEVALALQADLADKIVASGARGVLVDISGLEIVDSFIGRVFADIAATASVLDAETVVVGMRPAVAMTLVDLGLSLGGVRTALNVEKGLKILRRDLGLTAAEDLDAISSGSGSAGSGPASPSAGSASGGSPATDVTG